MYLKLTTFSTFCILSEFNIEKENPVSHIFVDHLDRRKWLAGFSFSIFKLERMQNLEKVV